MRLLAATVAGLALTAAPTQATPSHVIEVRLKVSVNFYNAPATTRAYICNRYAAHPRGSLFRGTVAGYVRQGYTAREARRGVRQGLTVSCRAEGWSV